MTQEMSIEHALEIEMGMEQQQTLGQTLGTNTLDKRPNYADKQDELTCGEDN
jgi:hypothetical protein